MKLEPFNQNTKRWDRFNEFYNAVPLINSHAYYHEPFIHLETGEFIVTQDYYRPPYRKHYPDANVGIFNSGDHRWSSLLRSSNKMVTPDGDEVKPSWLDHRGAQRLWIDYDTQTVLSMHHTGPNNVDKRIPKRLRNHALVYYCAADEQPIAAAPIKVTEVDPLNPDEKAHVKAIVAACKAWNTLSEEAQIPSDVNYYRPNIHTSNGYVTNKYFIPRAKVHVSNLLAKDFATMTWSERKQVAMRGIQSRNKTTEYAYLKLIAR